MLRQAALGAAIVSFIVCVACSGRDRGTPRPDSGTRPEDTGTATGAIRIDPADATLLSRDGMPATQAYRAFLQMAGGGEVEVTDEASFSLAHADLGTFAGSTFTAAPARGGRTTVFANARGERGSTPLTVRVETVIIEEGAPPDAPSRFGGADDPAAAPEIVYPSDGTLVPPNLNELEIHFLPGPGNTVFEVRFEGSAVDLRAYVGCTAVGSGCVYTPSDPVWRLLSEAERGQDPATFTVRGTDGSRVGTSAPRRLGFAEEDMIGGLYYWDAGAGAVRRYEFGRRGASAESFMDAARARATTCVGCHVLSRDGSRIAVGLDIPAPSPYRIFEVSTRTELWSYGGMFAGGANFFSFSPDNAQLLDSDGAKIVLRNAATGTVIEDPLIASGAMPDFSPDGMRIVYSKPSSPPPCFPPLPCGGPGVDSASLETHVSSAGTWSAGPTLVPFAGQNNYYPSWSPDGGWVMFNRSASNNNSYDAPDAAVWVVTANGTRVVQLAHASTAESDSWPKWAPTIYMNHGRALFWLTFSSRRAIGVRPAGGNAQIWMAAFDPAAPDDPSLPAFWLPFQERASGNHIAQWVLHVDRQPCGTTPCPGGEFCEDGVCVPDLI